MNKKQFGEEFKSSYCIVTVPCSLSSFFPHDPCNKVDKKVNSLITCKYNFHAISANIFRLSITVKPGPKITIF